MPHSRGLVKGNGMNDFMYCTERHGKTLDEQYGRRIEADRSWTVYHVFSGIPAGFGSDALMGLSRSEATDRMLFLNRRSAGRSGGRRPGRLVEAPSA